MYRKISESTKNACRSLRVEGLTLEQIRLELSGQISLMSIRRICKGMKNETKLVQKIRALPPGLSSRKAAQVLKEQGLYATSGYIRSVRKRGAYLESPLSPSDNEPIYNAMPQLNDSQYPVTKTLIYDIENIQLQEKEKNSQQSGIDILEHLNSLGTKSVIDPERQRKIKGMKSRI